MAGQTKIGFIGLGIMGLPMAKNLVQAGFAVSGHNRSPAAVEKLVQSGGIAAGSIAAAVAEADVVITMLPDSPDVEQVLLGADGVTQHTRPGTLLIDMSTIRPNVARKVAAAAGQKSLRALDAPVSGGETGAVEGALAVMVGGAAADVDAARPVLDVMAATVVHVGPAGAGQIVKAANQLIVAGTIQLVAEALVFLEAHGADTERAVEVLSAGLAGNRILERKAAGMLARSFAPGFRIDLHHKDLGILLAAARDAQAFMPVGTLVAELMAALRAQGHGRLDHTALMLQVDQLSGRASQGAESGAHA